MGQFLFMQLPTEFVQRLHVELPGFASNIVGGLDAAPLSASIRVNQAKTHALPQAEHTPVPWSESAFWLQERPVFTLDPAFHAGAYYVQESASMLLSAVLKKLPAPKMAIDLSAAPGGKSTLLADALAPDGWMIANEIVPKRAEILAGNIERWGNSRVVVSNASGATLAATGIKADLLLIDAPCSGEGMFRKDTGSRSHWHHKLPQQCSALQRQIFDESLTLVRHGGFVIYSTCTFSLAENEVQWYWLVAKGLEPYALRLPTEWGFVDAHEVDPAIPKGYAYHSFPGYSQGEGFFIAVFQKRGDAPTTDNSQLWQLLKPAENLPEAVSSQLQWPAHYVLAGSKKGVWYAGLPAQLNWCAQHEASLKLLRWGTALGEMLQGKRWMPAHALALAADVRVESVRLELKGTLALWYLSRKEFQLNAMPPGNFIIQYQKHALGWGFNQSGKMVNCYPATEKIRMLAQQVVKVLGG